MTDRSHEPPDSLIDRIADRVSSGLKTLFGPVVTADVFATLERTDDRLLIGASAIERTGGFGFGGGEGVDSAGDSGGGGGGGGGGMGQARPIAVIEVTGQGVKIWPVIDYTKLALVAVGVIAAIWRARR